MSIPKNTKDKINNHIGISIKITVDGNFEISYEMPNGLVDITQTEALAKYLGGMIINITGKNGKDLLLGSLKRICKKDKKEYLYSIVDNFVMSAESAALLKNEQPVIPAIDLFRVNRQ